MNLRIRRAGRKVVISLYLALAAGGSLVAARASGVVSVGKAAKTSTAVYAAHTVRKPVPPPAPTPTPIGTPLPIPTPIIQGPSGECNGGNFANPTNVGVNGQPTDVVAADINGDGNLDLAASVGGGFNSVFVRLNDGGGTFGSPSVVAMGTQPASLVVADFNADSKLDLATANYNSNDVSVRLGDGTGAFAPVVNYDVGNNPHRLHVADFNGDSAPDLAIANFGSNFLSILLGSSSGTFTAAPNVTMTYHADGLSSGDITGDGNLDLIAAYGGTGPNNISVFPGNGQGGLGAATVHTDAETDIHSTVVADINGDGILDIASVTAAYHRLNIMFGTGNGGFAEAVRYHVGSQAAPRQLLYHDVNNDGIKDFVVANSSYANPSFTIFNGTGGGNFDSALSYPTTTAPHRLAIGDFNDDGRPDLAAALSNNNNITLYFNGCTNMPRLVLQAGVSVTEGEQAMANFAVSLSPTGPRTVTVDYTVTGGTATAGDDFTAVSGKITFPPNSGSQTISVPIIDDEMDEADETFTVTLNNPINATSLQDVVTATIINDDITGLVVTTTADTVADDGVVSLREAINYANARPGPHTIKFEIPTSDAGYSDGVFTIKPTSGLPALTRNGITIDGSTQTAFSGDTNPTGPEIVVNGRSRTIGIGLTLEAANCVVRDLVINGFTSGIHIVGEAADGNQIRGCYIGTNATGTEAVSQQDGIGIAVGADNNLIGGSTPAERNVISGNDVSGIYIFEANTTGNRVQGNYIGTAASGTGAIPNGQGFMIGGTATHTQIGGTLLEQRNIISGNLAGIRLFSGHHTVQGNYIGIDVNGNALGNTYEGVHIMVSEGAEENLIGGTAAGASNVIANNGWDGVFIEGIPLAPEQKGNSVRRNSIYGNTGLGINLDFPVGGDTPNDAGDSDGGPNGFQNFPVITRALTSDGNTAISGTLNSKGNTTFAIELYANVAAHASGFGEGQMYLDTITVTTNSLGNATFARTIPNLSSGFISATATNTVTGDTSEFSRALPVTSGKIITGRVSNNSGAGMAGVTVTRTASNNVVAGTATTDANGDYIFYNVAAGSYTIAPLNTPALAGVQFNPASYTVTVAGSSPTNLNFAASFVVSGRVANHAGAGIANVQVKRVLNGSTVSTFTDSQGNYRFTGVRSGTYTISPVLTPAMSGMSFTPVSRSVTVDRSNVFNQSFIGMFSISGRIANHSGVGIPDVHVKRMAGSFTISTYTDSNGYYRFPDVRSDSYTLSAAAPSTRPGISFTPATRTVTVDRMSFTNQNFIAMFTLSGTITDSSGTPIADVSVRLSEGNTATTAKTDSSGNYRFTNVRSGTYTITPTDSIRTFAPTERSGVAVGTASVAGQDFVGSG